MALNFEGFAADGDGIDLGTLNTTGGLSGLTLCCWIRPTAYQAGDEAVFFAKSNSTGNVGPWKLQIQDGGSDFRFILNTSVGGDHTLTDTTVFPTAQWMFVAGTYDGSNMRTFVNAVETASLAVTGTVQSNAFPTRLAGVQAGTFRRRFNGYMEDARIYSRALSQAELESLFVSRGASPIVHGLLHWWRMQERAPGVVAAGAGVIKDSGPQQFNGDVIDTPTYVEGILRGRRLYG